MGSFLSNYTEAFVRIKFVNFPSVESALPTPCHDHAFFEQWEFLTAVSTGKRSHRTAVHCEGRWLWWQGTSLYRAGRIEVLRKVLSLPFFATARSPSLLPAKALAAHGKPEIFNTDQGSQFTGAAFTGVLAKHEIRISMDGKGAWRDNVFIERLWRSVKYKEVYLHAYDSVGAARDGIGRYLDFYNCRRAPLSLDGRTPDDAFYGHDSMPPIRLAA